VIRAAQLIPFRGVVENATETERLKQMLAAKLRDRDPFYLTADEFERVLRWKLRRQFERRQDLRQANTDDVIRTITGAALTLKHADPDYELELRVGTLCVLRGVAVPVASAFLTLAYPEEYAVIDRRVWRQVFDEPKTTFTVMDYKRYLKEVRRLANELGWTMQEVDLAIWAYDRHHRSTSTQPSQVNRPTSEAPGARGTSIDLRRLETPEARRAAIASGLPNRKLWHVEQKGPFLIGGSNASDGAAVRDTRLPGTPDASGKPLCDTTFRTTVTVARIVVDAHFHDARWRRRAP